MISKDLIPPTTSNPWTCMNTETVSELPNPVEPPAKKPWDRQLDESENAFDLFQRYLELGADATLRDTAEATGKPVSTLRNYCSRHQWIERSAARRQHLAELEYSAAEKVTRDKAAFWTSHLDLIRRLEWENGQALHQAFRHATGDFIHNPESNVAIYALPKLCEAASKLLRRAAEPSFAPGTQATSKNGELALLELHKVAKIAYSDRAAALAAKQAQSNPQPTQETEAAPVPLSNISLPSDSGPQQSTTCLAAAATCSATAGPTTN
jgi:hypothetical protein